jgi:hypothetical protein
MRTSAAAVCAGVVSVMSTLECRAVRAMAERVGLREDRIYVSWGSLKQTNQLRMRHGEQMRTNP